MLASSEVTERVDFDVGDPGLSNPGPFGDPGALEGDDEASPASTAMTSWTATCGTDAAGTKLVQSNARCVGSGEDTAPFNGTQSGARYNWVEECGCFPAGVFGALGNGTTLAQDRSRLAQLRRDGWLGPQVRRNL